MEYIESFITRKLVERYTHIQLLFSLDMAHFHLEFCEPEARSYWKEMIGILQSELESRNSVN